MINPSGADRIAGKIAEQGLKENVAKPQEADADQQARFQDGLQGQGEPKEKGTEAVGQVESSTGGAQAPEQVGPPDEESSPGDAILQGIDKMRTEFQGIGEQVKNIADKEDVSPQDVLKAQLQVNRVMIEEASTSQAVSKVDQGVNSLVKGQ
ncbi:MAG: hypothetical protein GY701_05720 [Sulfitobacter sp.]|nr:hypothetical protein [Sulfitobacter sp.]